jgi:hypothetical protein
MNSPNLSLPYIAAAQAQKHVTHNEAVRQLDALVQLCVLDMDLAAPPAAPADGSRYIVAASPTGAWAGQAARVAAYQDGGWVFLAPREGWLAWVADEDKLVVFTGTAWINQGGGAAVNPASLVGVNATADAANRLAVSSANSLFNHEGGNHRLKINKATATDTSSVLFQTGFSGRAEFGLTGSDDFAVKVSPDGSSFKTAITVDRSTGKVSMPQLIAPPSSANLFPDSGRFGGTANNASIVTGTFAAPSYLSVFNGSSITGHSKFVFDNATFGGSGAALSAEALALITKVRSASVDGPRRYNSEFHLAQIAMGTGTIAPIIDSTTGYLALFLTARVRNPVQTFHCQIRVVSGKARAHNPGDTSQFFLDGVSVGSSATLLPADGWKSLTIQDSVSASDSIGYSPETLRLSLTPGAVALMACACLVPGLASFDPKTLIIPHLDTWK